MFHLSKKCHTQARTLLEKAQSESHDLLLIVSSVQKERDELKKENEKLLAEIEILKLEINKLKEPPIRKKRIFPKKVEKKFEFSFWNEPQILERKRRNKRSADE